MLTTMTPRKMGEKAYTAGTPLNANPFTEVGEILNRTQWARGWIAQKSFEDRFEEMM